MGELIDQILRLRRTGMTTNQIAPLLGLTSQQVSAILKDPTIADPVSGTQVSRSVLLGDITIVNPADPDVEVNVGAPLHVVPGHPVLVDMGMFAAIDPAISSADAIINSGVVAVRLAATIGGVPVAEFEDWLAIGEDGRSWQAVTSHMTDQTCHLQVVARFLEGTLPTFTATSLGGDFKLTARHYNADNTDFVDKITATISHGATPAEVAAALNAVDDLPGVFAVVAGGANEYVITAPHKYVQMDVVNAATGLYDAAVGGVIPGEFDVPDAPQSIQLQDVSIFFGTA